MIIAINSQPKSHITHCPTNSLWFIHWSIGCDTRIGYIIKRSDFKYIVSINDIQIQTGYTIICKTRSKLTNLEVLHGPSVHGCVFLCFIERKLRLKCEPTSDKDINK